MSEMYSGPTETRLTLDPRVIKVLSYWDTLRGTRTVPSRVDVRPSMLSQHLSRICILERPRAGTLRMRLAGATVSARMGMELRGMPLRALFDIDHRARAMDAAETAMTTPAISVLSLGRVDRSGIAVEGLLAILPMTDTRGALTRAMAIYSEHPSVTRQIDELHGRFTVQEAWSLDIPESGSVLDTLGEGVHRLPLVSAISEAGAAPDMQTQNVNQSQDASQAGVGHFRPRLATDRVAERGLPVSDPPRGPERAHVRRPLFQVIDGGRT